MLNKTYDWLRIVYAKPDDEVVRKRQLACKDLVKRIDEAEDVNLLIQCVAGIINGFESGFTKDSEAVSTIISCIIDHQPAFTSDLSNNALELRACAMIALGEIITREVEKSEEPSDDAVLASLLLLSGAGLRPKVQERYLKITLDELIKFARTAAGQAAVAKRQRTDLDFEALGEVAAGADTTSLLKSLRPVLKELFKQLEQQAAVDREELQVLSWLHNNYAETVGKSIADLDPFEAAMCCGIEVADMVRIPPIEGIRQMVADAVVRNRKKPDLKKITLVEVIEQLSRESQGALLSVDANVRKLVQRFAPLFPMSWICLRIGDSGSPTGWEEEFQNKAGFPATENYAPEVIARQVFNERVAQRECAGDKEVA
jgi:GTPase-associated system-like protein